MSLGRTAGGLILNPLVALFIFALLFVPIGLLVWGIFLEDSLRMNGQETVAHVLRLHETRGRRGSATFYIDEFEFIVNGKKFVQHPLFNGLGMSVPSDVYKRAQRTRHVEIVYLVADPTVNRPKASEMAPKLSIWLAVLIGIEGGLGVVVFLGLQQRRSNREMFQQIHEAKRYILRDGVPVEEPDYVVWSNWFHNFDRNVEVTKCGPMTVMTKFNGIDDGGGLYEVTIVGGPLSGWKQRYRTPEDAHVVHEQIAAKYAPVEQ